MKSNKTVHLITRIIVITLLTTGCKKEDSVGMSSNTSLNNNGSANSGFTASSNSPVPAGSTLTLSASAISGATYYWTGPSGFVSSDQNPSRANFSAAYAGTYTATATVAGSGYYSQGTSYTASVTVSQK